MRVSDLNSVDKEMSIGDLMRKVESLEYELNRSEAKCKEVIKENSKLKDTVDDYLLSVNYQ